MVQWYRLVVCGLVLVGFLSVDQAVAATPQVAAGAFHNVALAVDGTVWTWGSNGYGQLCDPNRAAIDDVPAPIPGLSGVMAVSAGENFTVALKDDGTVWTCGQNDRAQLGWGTSSWEGTLGQVVGISEVIKVSGGANHLLALKNNGTVWGWGSDYGKLGVGPALCNPLGYCTSPVQALNLSGVTEIKAGAYHSMALTNGGAVWAWGLNVGGQLGQGDTLERSEPTLITSLSNITDIGAGDSFSLACSGTGALWAWGSNEFRALGTATTTNQSSPVEVLAAGSGIVKVAAGTSHSLALKDNGGTFSVLAWGNNSPKVIQGSSLSAKGALGLGNTTDYPTPTAASSWGTTGAMIRAGMRHSMVVLADGTVKTSGENNAGQQGDPAVPQDLTNGYRTSAGTVKNQVGGAFNLNDPDGDTVTGTADVCPGFDDTLDADGDGVPDGCDLCAAGNDNDDADLDGVPDACDLCNGDDASGNTDGDLICNDLDNCPDVVNDTQADSDGDGDGDACDLCAGFADSMDVDGDGIPNGCDTTWAIDAVAFFLPSTFDWLKVSHGPMMSGEYIRVDGTFYYVMYTMPGSLIHTADSALYYTAQLQQCDQVTGAPLESSPGVALEANLLGLDGQMLENFLTWPDSDFDGVFDIDDLCPGFPDSADADTDGVPDGCDACPGFPDSDDLDNDGVPAGCDNCPNHPNVDQNDFDQDTLGDVCDACSNDPDNDIDQDGVCGNLDLCPTLFDDQSDGDGDGVGDACDNCPNISNSSQSDVNGNFIGDACDSADTDNDGYSDAAEIAAGTNPNDSLDFPKLPVAVNPTGPFAGDQVNFTIDFAGCPGASSFITLYYDANGDGSIDSGDVEVDSALVADTYLDTLEVIRPSVRSDGDLVGGDEDLASGMVSALVDLTGLILQPGTYLVRAEDCSGLAGLVPVDVTAAGATTRNLNGLVVDSNLNPVAGAMVSLVDSQDGTLLSVGFSDGSGHYTIEGPDVGTSLGLDAQRFPDYFAPRQWLTLPDPVNTYDPVVDLSDAGLTGTIQDFNTLAPVGRVRVNAVSSDGLRRQAVRSDDQGHYDLSVLSGEAWSLWVSNTPGYYAARMNSSAPGVQAETIHAGTQRIVVDPTVPGSNLMPTFDFYPETAVIDNMVLTNGTLQPVEYATVYASCADQSCPDGMSFAITDADGFIDVGVSTGLWMNGIYADNGLYTVNGQSIELVPSAPSTVNVTPTDRILSRNHWLYPAEGVIEGRVADVADTPCSDCVVIAESTTATSGGNGVGGSLYLVEIPDANGDYHLPVLAGNWTVRAEHLGQGLISQVEPVAMATNGDAVIDPVIETVTGVDLIVQPDTCFDGLLNGDETDVDCGGSCGACVVPQIQVTSPNGGESIVGGSNHTITWTDVIGAMSHRLFYSTNGGSNWSLIAVVGSVTSFNWAVPDIVGGSTTCLVRVNAFDASQQLIIRDDSDAVFEITENTFQLSSPNGGESLVGGSNHTITWTAASGATSYRLFYSTNGGSNWSLITVVGNVTSYNWTVPVIVGGSTTCLVRVNAFDGSQQLINRDDSDAIFDITENTFQLSSPNGGESLVGGSNHTITWTAANGATSYRLFYSTNGGSNWSLITVVGSVTSYNWTVPVIVGGAMNCLVRVNAFDASQQLIIRDDSNTIFEITENTFQLTSPNGGESLVGGSNHTISWTAVTGAANYRLFYSINGGSNWNLITVVGSVTSYNWTVPVVVGGATNCLVRVNAFDGGQQLINRDDSDAVFEITENTFQVTSPNGGELLVSGNQHTVTWSVASGATNYRLFYSTDNGASWNWITVVGNVTSYNWTVPVVAGGSVNCLLRVNAFDGSQQYINRDDSDTVFTIN